MSVNASDKRNAFWHKAASWCGWETAIIGSDDTASGRYAFMTDYKIYRMNRKEVAASVLAGAAVLFTASYLVYHSTIVSAIASLAGVAAPRMRRGTLLRRRRERLKLQFKELLFSLTSSLAAGRSAENAFRAALEDLSLLYPEPQTDMLRELRIIGHLLDRSVPLEEAILDFAQRAGIDEITMFADTLTACKRSGGDLLEVMRRTSTLIGEKMNVDGEIQVLLAQKRFEARIMMAVPFVFLGFLGLAAPEYMSPLYEGFGYVLLTSAMLLLGGCYWLIVRIMSIEM